MNPKCQSFSRVALLLGILQLADLGVSGSIILHYEFSTNLLDSSSNGLPSTASGTPRFVAGPYGYGSALSFDNGVYSDGTHYPYPPQYLDCGAIPTTGQSNTLTLMFWVKWTGPASADRDVIFDTGTSSDGWSVFRDNPTNHVVFELRRTNDTILRVGANIPNDGRWQHYAGVWTPSQFKLLRNGKIVAGAGPPPSPRLARLFVGGQPGQSAFFSGLLDDLRLDNEALSEAQIRRSLDTHPPLSIARDASRVLVTWPATADYFVLEQRTALAQDAPNWRPVTASSSVAGDFRWVALERILPNCFFRLRAP